MSIYNSPYKSGTTTNINGTQTTVAGFTPVANDVGRIAIINSGNAKLQHRKITAVSGQVLTLAHTWNTNPFIDPTIDARASDVIPDNGSTIVISYDLDDLISTDSDITQSNTNQIKFNGTLRLEDGAYVHVKNKNLDLRSDNVEIATGAGLIFGYYGYVPSADGIAVDSCNIVDTASGSGGDQWRRATESFGLFDMYGGNLLIANAAGVFARMYANTPDPSNVQVRIINVAVNGSFGSRIEGNRSILLIAGADSISTLGVANPRGSVARIEFSVYNSRQAAYVWLVEGPSGTATFNRLTSINNNILRVVGNGNDRAGTNGVFNVIAKKSEVDAAPAFADVSSGNSAHTLRYANLLKPTFANVDLSAVTGALQIRTLDNTNALVNTATVTDGKYPEFLARHTDIPTSTGTRNLSDGVQYAPYSIRAVQYGKQFLSATANVEDEFSPSLTMFDDLLITETKAQALSRSTVSNAEQFHNSAVAWLEDNVTTESGFLLSRTSNRIDAGSFNVFFDENAPKEFDFDGSTITINSSDLTGSIITTGIVTLNGASISDGYTDSTGSFAVVSDSKSGLFNIAARHTGMAAGDYYPFRENVNSSGYVIPLGEKLQFAAWKLGKLVFTGEIDPSISSSLAAGFQDATAIDATVDVTDIMNSIDIEYGDKFTMTFNAPLDLNVEQVKAMMHRVLSDENALNVSIATSGGIPALSIGVDDITINNPKIVAVRGNSLSVTDQVILRVFVNTDLAVAQDSSYTLTPPDANNIPVITLIEKPALDRSQLASAVRTDLAPELLLIQSAKDNAQAVRLQTQKEI